MSGLPEPLTPADCDLRDFSFMPVDIIRLFGSRFHAAATDAEWRAGLTLWLKSFHQVPAASVPDDDVELARLAELGRDVRSWRKVRAGALHGWVKCADGRLYHPVVAEKANEAWARRISHRTERSAAAERQARWREEQKRMSARLREIGVKPPEKASKAMLVDLLARHGVEWTDDQYNAPRDVTDNADRNVMEQNAVTPPVTPVTPKTGTGTGTGTIPPNPQTPDHRELCGRVASEAGMLGIPPDHGLLREWLALPDMQLERDILPVVRRIADAERARSGKAPFRFKLFDAAIREQCAADQEEIRRLRSIAGGR